MIGVLVFVFGWPLPQFIDYDEVWNALTELDPAKVLVLLGLAVGPESTEALMYRAFLPGLRLWRGSEAYLSSNFAGQILAASGREPGPVRLLGAEPPRGHGRLGGRGLDPVPHYRTVPAPGRRGACAARHR